MAARATTRPLTRATAKLFPSSVCGSWMFSTSRLCWLSAAAVAECQLGWFGPNPEGRDGEVCGDLEEIPAPAWSVLAATALVGAVPLLGGVDKVCRHLHHLLLGLVAVFGRKPRFGVESA